MEDLLIIGAGPAGMTAGLYAARKGLTPLVVSRDIGGQATWSSSVENYMGFKDIRGSELMRRFEEHMKSQRLRYEECEVGRIAPAHGAFDVHCADGKTYSARAVIVATGRQPRTLDVPGEAEYRGKGVSYCATCDGPLYREARVAVIGGGNAGLQACHDLLAIAAEVHLITNEGITADQAVRDKVLGRPKLQLHEHHTVKAVLGKKMVEGVRIAGPDGRERDLAVEGVFIEVGLEPGSDLVGDAVGRNEAREIVVDCECKTNVKGLFAAGDVTTACGEQIIIAAGEGAKAALAAAEYLAFH
ncbi:MAG: NAD(P)/FAD-dependent oxidoreductase [Bacteroidota bacterium]